MTAGEAPRQRLSGAAIVVDYLVRQGVPYAVGIPGHGSWSLTDALLDRPEVRTIQVIHEQSAVHLADGYYRATGRPLLAFTSIGPGATNTVVGMATAYVDSTAVLLMTGSAHTYMRGHGLLQELERRHVADNPRIFEPVVKEWWQPSRTDELPFVLHRAWNAMLSGRPGPVLLDIPMDVQAESAEVRMPVPDEREATGRARPAADDIERAAALLRDAKRPVIVAGGGVITSEASAAIAALAERLGAPVVTTWNGKGAIDETHDLAAQTIGDTASTCGNELAASADVLLSVGCRFTDWSASSYRKGVTFSIPPTALIQLDVDAREIGKNYPVAVPLVGDARAGLEDLLAAVGRRGGGAGTYRDTPYFAEIQKRKAAWFEQVEVKSGSTRTPMTMARATREIQTATSDDAIVVTGAGLPQGMVKQRWVTRQPRTHITSGGFSTMGFELPAAIGAQLAHPDRQVLSISGDGSFMQSMQELATAAMLDIPVCQVILDNSGWISIKGGQQTFFGRPASTDFMRNGEPYSPDFGAIGRSFGLHSEAVTDPNDVCEAVRRALASGGPSVVAIKVDRDLDNAGPDKTGWWDVPIAESHPTQRAAQLEGRAEEQQQ
ncbi:MAG: thiamine pyrophosphate-binding protein [Chloroflexota bacterium]